MASVRSTAYRVVLLWSAGIGACFGMGAVTPCAARRASQWTATAAIHSAEAAKAATICVALGGGRATWGAARGSGGRASETWMGRQTASTAAAARR